MKKLVSLALTLVLTTVLFTGCGCTNQNMETQTMPTIMPTETTRATTAPTQATTQMTTEATTPSIETTPTVDRGNGPLEEATNAATSDMAEARSRRQMTGGR